MLKVSRIIGPIIDVDFEEEQLKIGQMLEISNNGEKLTLEIAGILGKNRVRTITLGLNETIVIGQEVKVLSE